jgi:hypothetical protein
MKEAAMAAIEKNGKRWNIRKADGTVLLDTKTGKPRYFLKEEWAELFADNVTNQEQNPHQPSWREAVQEARAKVWADMGAEGLL